MTTEQIIKEYWNEVDSIRRDLVENGEDGGIYRFGYKTKRGNELFTVVDWKNIESFILQVRTDTINEIRKEVEKFPTGMFDSTPYKKDLLTFLDKLDEKK